MKEFTFERLARVTDAASAMMAAWASAARS